MTEEKPCDWGPVSHELARHYVKYECPHCGTYKVFQLCSKCWNMVTGFPELLCFNCALPKRVSTKLLYTHMGTP